MNKKAILIPSLILSVVLAAGSLSNAFALYTQENSPVEFGISQAIQYFLKGNFNSWTPANEYRLTDNTNSMVAEANKTSEYIISKAFSKNDEMKVWDSGDNWFSQGVANCSYVDKWDRVIANEANYTIPMSGTYDISLKFYSTGVKKIEITTADITVLYLKPNSNWLSDGARFAAYFFNNSTSTNEWHDMVADGDYYKVTIPSGYSDVIFCRMNPDEAENVWGNKWNQTADLSFDVTGYQNTFEIPGSTWDDAGNGNWGSI